jgi:AbrB family looped-hinge helix DNA binding protein
MTTTLSARGQIVIPSAVRAKLGLREGDDFIVLCSADREILLRPVRQGRRKSLLRALRAMSGLELAREDELVRDIEL